MNMETPNNDIIVFLDQIGQLIIGTLVESGNGYIDVEYPCISVITNNNNQMGLSLIPVLPDFISKRPNLAVWRYTTFTRSTNAELIEQVEKYYTGLRDVARSNTPVQAPTASASTSGTEAPTLV